MDKLSVLIFSKDYVDNTLDLAKDVCDIADEIVVMDASGKSETEMLKKGKALMKLDKLRLFHVPAIGYPDPLRMYALKKCKGNWVIYIDTDERLSEELKKDIRRVIAKGEYDAYAIKRYEEVKDRKNLPLFFTWQIRLFKKDMVAFTGMPHEQARVNGKLGRLEDKKHYMMHMSALMSRKTQLDYNKIEQFERLTYGMYNERMLDYLSKFRMGNDRNAKNTLSGRVLLSLLGAYQRITSKKKDQELTDFDYFFYYSTLDLIYYTLEGNLPGIFGIIPKERKHVKQINMWKNAKDGGEIFEISKILNSVGIIEFLHLDREEEIEKINKRKEKGAALLLNLIRERYKEVKSRG